ncbi:15932_t:CDS:2, partial [Funneliformis mosseae]
MVDGRYALVYINSTGFDVDSIFPQEAIYVLILEYDQKTEREPAVLYHKIQGFKIIRISCDVFNVGVGQFCVVTGENENESFKKPIYIKFNFLSCGTVYDFKQFHFQTNPSVEQYFVQILPYGGYLLRGIANVDGQNIYDGYVFNDYNETYPWNLSIIESSSDVLNKILRNNTFVHVRREENQSWTLVTKELYKFNEDREFLQIKYYNKVELSYGNITIFQSDGNIRQIISGIDQQYIFHSEAGDFTTINITILKSTFNQPGRRYYVSIDNGFVKDKIHQEPLYGIKDQLWAFTTIQQETGISSDEVMGQVRLTPEGTSYFLYEADRKDFLTKLIKELADAIPVSPECITTNEGFEVDTSVSQESQKQIFLSIDIKKNETEFGSSFSFLSDDLDNLIMNKRITVIALGETTRYLDESYGYKAHPNVLKAYGITLVGAFVVAILLLGVYLYAKNENEDAKNTVIFQISIVIFDIIMDITFIITKAKNVEVLYIPSIVFFIFPFTISMILAFIIIKKEEQRREFLEWSRENRKFVELFTLFAGSEIGMLYVLESKVRIGGLNIFNAKFSKEALKRIYWASWFNIFFEDIPQFVIQ